MTLLASALCVASLALCLLYLSARLPGLSDPKDDQARRIFRALLALNAIVPVALLALTAMDVLALDALWGVTIVQTFFTSSALQVFILLRRPRYNTSTFAALCLWNICKMQPVLLATHVSPGNVVLVFAIVTILDLAFSAVTLAATRRNPMPSQFSSSV